MLSIKTEAVNKMNKFILVGILVTLVSTLTTVSTLSTVSAQNMTQTCTDNGNIAPCLDEKGALVILCDDPAFKNKTGQVCMPSAQEWMNFLPTCSSVSYKSSCTQFGALLWTCDDPEFNYKKYTQGCMDTDVNVKPSNNNNNNNNNNDNSNHKSSNNNNHKTALKDCNGGENGPPCILADDSIGYSCKDDRHFKSDGNQCLFWHEKNNGWGLRIDMDGITDNNNNDNHKKKIDKSDDNICDSDPSTKAPSCDDFDNNGNYKQPKDDFQIQGNLS
jgi:hypothetical protein